MKKPKEFCLYLKNNPESFSVKVYNFLYDNASLLIMLAAVFPCLNHPDVLAKKKSFPMVFWDEVFGSVSMFVKLIGLIMISEVWIRLVVAFNRTCNDVCIVCHFLYFATCFVHNAGVLKLVLTVFFYHSPKFCVFLCFCIFLFIYSLCMVSIGSLAALSRFHSYCTIIPICHCAVLVFYGCLCLKY
ncbi:hypothetical protein L596_028671 [Steinernema carpocapsae]|uniref:Uncharacterized protein n=1 Tax=Steinernema carpocapsae TaxID=34508 RepID=A0A4U5LZ26_STECR|nr:hypothetical protein L596_028671 [Steinernema carpocapsae]